VAADMEAVVVVVDAAAVEGITAVEEEADTEAV
jgi:hypothetical protein